MNGPGYYTDATGKQRQTMFHWGLEVRMDEQNPDCYNLMWLNFIFSATFIGMLVAYIINYYTYNGTTFLILSIIFYVAVIIETFCSRTWKFLTNIEPSSSAIPIINNYRAKYPIVQYNMQNYHYEWRAHTVHRKGEPPHVEMRRVRVNTHHARSYFRYLEWVDQSPDASAIDYIRSQKLTRLDLKLNFTYTPISSQSYQCQEYDFKRMSHMDTHYSYWVEKSLEGWRDGFLMHDRAADEPLPFVCSKTAYLIMSFLCVGWLFRYLFVS